MGTKRNPGKYDCYAKAEPDEPIFVLRASDPLAADLVRTWAGRYAWNSSARGGGDEEKYEEALACAEAMEIWYRERNGEEPASDAVHTLDSAAVERAWENARHAVPYKK